jgi:multidrug efflux pump subunit AcrA (membrane-fusion protein)
MRRKGRRKGRKVTTILIACAVIAVGSVGLAAAVKKTTGGDSRVLVVPVSDLTSGDWGQDMSFSGTISSGTTQRIYPDASRIIQKIEVTEGASVKKGDPILTYDTNETSLNLEKEKLNQDQIRLQIEVAEKNLATLSKIKPAPFNPEPVPDDGLLPDGGSDFEPDDPDNGNTDNGNPDNGNPDNPDDGNPDDGNTGDPDNGNPDDGDTDDPDKDDDKPDVPATEVVLNKVLDEKASYFCRADQSAAPGTEGNPYQFLTVPGAPVKAGFLTLVKSLGDPDGSAYFMIETRVGARPTGRLVQAFCQSAETLPEVTEDFEAYVPKADSFVLPLGKSPADGTNTDAQDSDQGEPSGKDSDQAEPSEKDSEQSAATLSGESRVFVYTSAEAVRTAYTSSDASESGDTDASSGANTMPSSLISPDASYTKEELAEAKKEQQDTLASLRLDYRESELKVKRAQDALSQGVVTALFDGVVKIAGDPANPPQDGSPILRVDAENGMTVQGDVSEKYYDSLKEGMTLTVESYETGGVYEAKVTSVSLWPSGSESDGVTTQTVYPFTAVIENPDEQLTTSSWVELRMDQQAEDSDVLMLDRAFVRTDDGSPYVYVDRDGVLKKQPVKIGRPSFGSYEILSGLTMDDQIAFPYGNATKKNAKTKQGDVSEIYQ